MQGLYEFFGLTPSRTVPNCHRLNLILFNQRGEFATRACPLLLRLVGINRFIMEQVALSVETHHLTSRAEARVYTHDALLSERSGKEQLLEVCGKHTNRLFIRTLL